jgi:hypothetical protein
MTTTLAKLLEQKQQLIERLHEDLGPDEREQIERLLEQINTALDLLDGAGMSGSTSGPYVSVNARANATSNKPVDE